MIQAQFGLPEIAARTLEVYTTATLDATLARPRRRSAPAWRDAMDRLADDGARASIARSSTTTRGSSSISGRRRRSRSSARSRSAAARHGARGGRRRRVAARDPLGVRVDADAAAAAVLAGRRRGAPSERLARGERALLREMYRDWPFFQSTLDLIEMVLAESDVHIAAEYDRRLLPTQGNTEETQGPQKKHRGIRAIGADLRRRLNDTARILLAITGRERLLESQPVLRTSIELRNPYVDPINLVQIELLRRLRSDAGHDPAISKAFMITVNGIAAGMRNTG